jgi:prepilin-type N-terminal cleavage/methylation domain-containing protein
MNKKGITLVELAVALSVVAILVSSLGVSYQDWMINYEIESATKELYSDLMYARLLAMEKGREHILVLDGKSYTIFDDKDGDRIMDPGEELPSFPKTVKYELRWNNQNSKRIYCYDRGTLSEKSVWFKHDEKPDYDCVAVSFTRVITGKHTIVRENGEDKDKCKID